MEKINKIINKPTLFEKLIKIILIISWLELFLDMDKGTVVVLPSQNYPLLVIIVATLRFSRRYCMS